MASIKNTSNTEAISPWESTKTQYLIRYRPSGVYFAKFKAGGKQFRFRLNTTVPTVAQVRLTEERRKRGRVERPDEYDTMPVMGVRVSAKPRLTARQS